MVQAFKATDTVEAKVYEALRPIVDAISLDEDDFYDQAYSTYGLGGVLYDLGAAPLTNAIRREIFLDTFTTLFASFRFAGTFELYISTFKSIFGDDAVVEFTVPDPGKLEINIEASGVVLDRFVARNIEDDEFVYHPIVDEVGDNIVFSRIKGFQTQYETETMLFQVVPGGIFTTITLTIG